jgi:hypothetical protein
MMFLLSIFELSSKVEEAVTALEIEGIPRDAIKAVSMDVRDENKKLFDSSHYSDNSTTLALPFALAMFGTFFGVVYGFQLYWGPILWGLIGAVTGFAAGILISLVKAKTQKSSQRLPCKPLVTVIVQCLPEQLEKVKSILWTNAAMSVRSLE